MGFWTEAAGAVDISQLAAQGDEAARGRGQPARVCHHHHRQSLCAWGPYIHVRSHSHLHFKAAI